MDNVKTDSSDFYPAMVMREVILWIGRLIAFIFVLIMFYNFDNDTELLIRLLLILV
jgi:Na+/H+ antiporter NhaC